MEDSTKKDPIDVLHRLRKGTSPAAAVAGAFASFAAAARGAGLKPSDSKTTKGSLINVGLADTKPGQVAVLQNLPLRYLQCGKIETGLQRKLSGISIGPGDGIYVLGDGLVRVFERTGKFVHSFKVSENATCIDIESDGKIGLGAADRVHLLDKSGASQHTFEAGDVGHPAKITAVKLLAKEILVADAAARCIVRFDYSGKRIGDIGTGNKTHGFILPNKSLDMDVDSNGTIVATDSGRHRVSAWKLDGTPVRDFGKFGVANPADFVGCCNPVNLAFTPEGRIVTAEKVAARVKVFDPEGNLLALIGPEHFDPNCTMFHLAVDSRGRILVADPMRMEVKIFSAAVKTEVRENV